MEEHRVMLYLTFSTRAGGRQADTKALLSAKSCVLYTCSSRWRIAVGRAGGGEEEVVVVVRDGWMVEGETGKRDMFLILLVQQS